MYLPTYGALLVLRKEHMRDPETYLAYESASPILFLSLERILSCFKLNFI